MHKKLIDKQVFIRFKILILGANTGLKMFKFQQLLSKTYKLGFVPAEVLYYMYVFTNVNYLFNLDICCIGDK